MHVLEPTTLPNQLRSTELNLNLVLKEGTNRLLTYTFSRDVNPVISIPCKYGMVLEVSDTQTLNEEYRIKIVTNQICPSNPLTKWDNADYEDAVALTQTKEFQSIKSNMPYIDDVKFYEISKTAESILIGFAGRTLFGYHTVTVAIHNYRKRCTSMLLRTLGELNPYSYVTTDYKVNTGESAVLSRL